MKHTQPPSDSRLTLVVNQAAAQHSDERLQVDKRSGQTREDAFGTLLIEGLTLHIQSFYVRQFLDEILSEADLRQVLATPVRADGKTVRLLVQVVQPIAEEAQRIAKTCTQESEAVFVATLLHGVDYCFFPALRGKYDAPDALKSIVQPALQRLERQAPEAATVLRTCMRWGNFDEEGLFIDWLEQRMQHALQVLKLATF